MGGHVDHARGGDCRKYSPARWRLLLWVISDALSACQRPSACRRFQMYCCLAPNDAQGHVWTAVYVSEQDEVASSGAAKCRRHIGFLRERQPSVPQHFRLKKRLRMVCNCADDPLSLNLASAGDQRRHRRRGQLKSHILKDRGKTNNLDDRLDDDINETCLDHHPAQRAWLIENMFGAFDLR